MKFYVQHSCDILTPTKIQFHEVLVIGYLVTATFMDFNQFKAEKTLPESVHYSDIHLYWF